MLFPTPGTHEGPVRAISGGNSPIQRGRWPRAASDVLLTVSSLKSESVVYPTSWRVRYEQIQVVSNGLTRWQPAHFGFLALPRRRVAFALPPRARGRGFLPFRLCPVEEPTDDFFGRESSLDRACSSVATRPVCCSSSCWQLLSSVMKVLRSPCSRLCSAESVARCVRCSPSLALASARATDILPIRSCSSSTAPDL